MACKCNEQSFRADAEPTGENTLLRITGTCTCPTTGYWLSLEPDDTGGINPQPDEVVLHLVEHAPSEGAEVLSPTPVELTTVISDDVRRVMIRTDDGRFAVPVSRPG